MEKIMIKRISNLCIALITIYSSITLATEKVTITAFITEEVEVCNKAFECEDILAKNLPDPSTVQLVIQSYDKGEGYIMFNYKDREMWVHQTEVELSKKAFASTICTAQVLSNKSDKATYATLGLGEGCVR